MNFLKNNSYIRNIHLIGIGGSSMSGLAEILLDLGYNVSGSDICPSNLTEKLQVKGVRFFPEHNPENVTNSDFVVYTSAVKEDNPEYMMAQQLGIPTTDRATLLGEIMKAYSCNIAISGTHGKTTTTSMISVIMLNSGKNPTIHIGGELKEIEGNTKIGSRDFFITEACEYMENFLKLYPSIGVILNIEEDHLDYFKDIQHIKDTFTKFIALIPENGYVVACSDDDNIRSILNTANCSIVTYGIEDKNANWQALNITFDKAGHARFNVYKDGLFFQSIHLAIPGLHNVYNSLAAIATCSISGVDAKNISSALSRFTGTHRRFELKGIKNGIYVIDDYAHHPSEIKATLSATQNISHSKTWCVFQPHTYTRTLALLDDFSTAFKNADEIIITDIYASREKDTGKIHASTLAEKIISIGKSCIYMSSFEEIVQYLRTNAASGDMVLTIGAGDVYKIGEMFLEQE